MPIVRVLVLTCRPDQRSICATLGICFDTSADPRSNERAVPCSRHLPPQLETKYLRLTIISPAQFGSLLPFLCLLRRLRPWPSTLILLRPLLPLRSSSASTPAADALLGTLTSSSISLCSLVGEVGASRVKLLRAKGLRPLRTADDPGW